MFFSLQVVITFLRIVQHVYSSNQQDMVRRDSLRTSEQMHSEPNLHSDSVTRARPEVLEQYSRVKKFAPIVSETDQNFDSDSPVTVTLEPVTVNSNLVSTSLASVSKTESEMLNTSIESSGLEINPLMSVISRPNNPQTSDPNQTSSVATQEQRTKELEMRQSVGPPEMVKGSLGHAVDPPEVTKHELGHTLSPHDPIGSKLSHPDDPQVVTSSSLRHPVDPEELATGSVLHPVDQDEGVSLKHVNPQVTKKDNLGQFASVKESVKDSLQQPGKDNLPNKTSATAPQQSNTRDIARYRKKLI
jgi:hypothetical protein